MFEDRTYLILLCAMSLVFLFSGAFCYSKFFDSDYIRFGLIGQKKWENSSGFSDDQFASLAIGTVSFSIGVALIALYAVHSFVDRIWSSKSKQIMYTLLCIGFAICGCFAFMMAFDIMSCGIIFCIGDTATAPDDSNHAAKNATGSLYFFCCLSFSLFFGGMFLRLYEESNPHVKLITPKSSNTSASPSKYRKRGLPSMSKITSRDNLLIGESLQDSPNPFSSPSSKTPSHMHKSALSDLVKRQEEQRALKYSSACVEIPCITGGKTGEIFPLYLVFGVLYPILIIASMILPTWWAGFSSFGLKTYAASKPDSVYGPYWYFQLTERVIFKMFPDVVVYNLAIYIVTVIALLSKKYPRISRLFNTTFLFPSPFGVSRWIFTAGECLLLTVFVILIAFQFCYFYTSHSWENKSNANRVNAELAARAMGQVSNLLTGLLLLPVSRNSVWSIVFGVSHKAMLGWHKYTGTLLLVSISAHAILWCVAYSAYGYFPQELFSIADRKFHAYNFTVPLAVLCFVAMVLFMGVCATLSMRQSNYDLFYIAHHFSMVVFLVMLWHATMCWYYIIAGLALWVADYYLRINSVINKTVVLQSCRVVVPNNQLTESAGIIELSYRVQRRKRLDKSKPSSSSLTTSLPSFPSFSSLGEIEMMAMSRDVDYSEIGAEVDLDDSIVEEIVRDKQQLREKTVLNRSNELLLLSERALKHRIGQYVLINIPSIDLFAWHPFSIASAPSESGGSTAHYIQALHPNEWTGKLYRLAEELGQVDVNRESDVLVSNTAINIEGPYGTPVDLTQYVHVVLIAGGIGITPIYSCYRQIYLQMIAKYLDFKHQPHANGREESAYEAAHFAEDAVNMRVRKISLCWAVKNRSVATIFEDKIVEMSQSALSYGSEKAFDFSLYLTKEEPRELPFNHSTSLSRDAESNAGSSIDENINILHQNNDVVHSMKAGDNLTLLEANSANLASEVKEEGNYSKKNKNASSRTGYGISVLNDDDGDAALKEESLSPTPTHIHYGRPNLSQIIAQLAADALYRRDEPVLIFACGPEGLVNECEELAHLHSIDFRGEKFQM